jgi:type I pantothenate kinase
LVPDEAGADVAGPDVSSLVDRLFVKVYERPVSPLDGPDDAEAVFGPLAAWIARRAGAEPDQSCDLSRVGEGQTRRPRGPFVVGVAGGIAAGKTTIAELLADLVRRSPRQPQVAVISADGFLHPNAELARRGLSQRKGFPDSYDIPALFDALATLRSGSPALIPGYSHLSYDVAPASLLQPPDVVVIEGIIVLQAPPDGAPTVPSDLIDLGVYVEAGEAELRQWYGERLAELFEAARHEPASFYHQWSRWEADEVARFADAIWQGINRVNLRHHIAPSRLRADVIVEKAADHRVSRVLVRRP